MVLAPLQHHLITLSIPLPALWLRFILVPLAHRGPKANHALSLTLRMHRPFSASSPACGSPPRCFTSPPSRSFPAVLVLSLLILLRPPVPGRRFSSPSLGHGTGGGTSPPSHLPHRGAGPGWTQPHGAAGSPHIYGGTRAGSCMGEAHQKANKAAPLQLARGCWVLGKLPGGPWRWDSGQHSPPRPWVERTVLSGNKSGQYLKIKVKAGA